MNEDNEEYKSLGGAVTGGAGAVAGVAPSLASDAAKKFVDGEKVRKQCPEQAAADTVVGV